MRCRPPQAHVAARAIELVKRDPVDPYVAALRQDDEGYRATLALCEFANQAKEIGESEVNTVSINGKAIHPRLLASPCKVSA